MPPPSEKKVYIRRRRPHHPALRRLGCDGNRVLADTFGNGTELECWILKNLGNNMFNIIAWHTEAEECSKICI